jgi:hypothetical protein
MSTEQIIAIAALVLAVPGFIVLIIRGLNRLISIMGRNIFHSDLSVDVIETVRAGKSASTKLKIVFAGRQSIILEDIRVVANLRLSRRLEKLSAWIQLIAGYLTYDLEGIREVTGTKLTIFNFLQIHLFRGPKILIWAFSILYGLYFLYITMIMFIFIPIGWPILISGPYGRFHLIAEHQLVRIRDADSQILLDRPILLRADTETIRLIEYAFRLRAPGFPDNTQVEQITQQVQRSIFRLPRKGQFIWQADETVQVRIRNRWHYSVTLGQSSVRII